MGVVIVKSIAGSRLPIPVLNENSHDKFPHRGYFRKTVAVAAFFIWRRQLAGQGHILRRCDDLPLSAKRFSPLGLLH